MNTLKQKLKEINNKGPKQRKTHHICFNNQGGLNRFNKVETQLSCQNMDWIRYNRCHPTYNKYLDTV